MDTATINGTDLAYIEHGRGQPVVLVHGGVGDYREWELQMPAFAASYRAIAVSCRGAWPNRKLEPGRAHHAGHLRRGSRRLHHNAQPGTRPPGRPLISGRLRWPATGPPPSRAPALTGPPRAARVFPARRQHPTHTAPSTEADGPSPAGRDRLHQVRRQRSPPSDEGVRPWRRRRRAPDLHDGRRRQTACRVDPRRDVPTFVGNVAPFKAQLRAGFPPLSNDDARSIRVPTLLVAGAESPAPLTAVTDRLEKLLPDVSRLNIAGASHNMFNSHPAEFNTGVIDFIGQH